MQYKSKLSKMPSILLRLTIALLAFSLWQNNAIGIKKYSIINPKIPVEFQGFKILHLSDLHNKDFRGKLQEKAQKAKPDVIFITGDLIDRRHPKIDIALDLAQQMVEIAPTYFVSGNHEEWSGQYEEVKQGLEDCGVIILEDSYQVLHRGRAKIGLMGIADPAIGLRENSYPLEQSKGYFQEGLTKLLEKKEPDFHILLSHRPEQFEIYQQQQIDLVFSGHAHGGQIRLPLIGGLIAPNQGLFPKYTKGVYQAQSTTMVVSPGLGNSLFPLRVFNPPEMGVVTLYQQ